MSNPESRKRILIVEPFFTGSHAAWAKGYQANSKHQVEILSLSGHHWKWRMHGGAVSLARQYHELEQKPDLILASDMLDVSTFLALTRDVAQNVPLVLYFHENQLTYPWSPSDEDVKLERDNHYAFINYTSALAADAVLFNSAYHKDSFLGELPNFLKAFPDYNELESVDIIEKKSQVLHLGMDLKRFDQYRANERNRAPLIIWNHRWEYDKNPEEFFRALYLLADEGLEFEVAILGENYPKKPAIFEEAKNRLGERVVQFGYAKSFEEYAKWLWKGDILPVTSYQDFFGGSLVEAIYCSCYPLLPDRLAYPEHIPQEFRKTLIYQGFDALVVKLKEAIQEIENTRALETASFVASYDWGVIGGKYDQLFENLCHKGY